MMVSSLELSYHGLSDNTKPIFVCEHYLNYFQFINFTGQMISLKAEIQTGLGLKEQSQVHITFVLLPIYVKTSLRV